MAAGGGGGAPGTQDALAEVPVPHQGRELAWDETCSWRASSLLAQSSLTLGENWFAQGGVPALFPDPPPLLGSCDGDPPTGRRGFGGRGGTMR